MNFRTLLLLSFIGSASLFAQNNCVNYHKTSCKQLEDSPMKFDSQSKSTSLGAGQISEFHMVGYEGLDYKLTICHEPILGDQLRFKVYQKKRILVKPEELSENETNYEEEVIVIEQEDGLSAADNNGKDSKFRLVKELLYDNKEDNYTNELEFTAAGSLSLIIEISVGASKSKNEASNGEEGCVGVLIEHIKTPS